MANLYTLPQPSVWLPYAHKELAGALSPGATLTNATAVSEVLLVGNVRFLTVRILATAAGSLTFAFARPKGVNPNRFLPSQASGQTSGELDPAGITPYATLAPSAVAVSANTEAVMQVTTNGEWFGVLTYTPSASGVVTWVDVSAL